MDRTDTQWAGDGSESNPYLITSAEELAGLAERSNAGETFEGKFFRLTADISLSDPAAPAEQKRMWENPIGYRRFDNDPDSPDYTMTRMMFKGTFDGNGHTISNMYFSKENSITSWDDLFNDEGIDWDGWDVALFGNLDGAVIRNLNIADAWLLGASNICGIACEAVNSTVENCNVQGTFVSGNQAVGGSAAAIAGRVEGSTFVNCTANADVMGIRGTGVLVGILDKNSTITNCRVEGNAYGKEYDTGGMVGYVGENCRIEKSFSAARAGHSYWRYARPDLGGFVGFNAGTIRECGASGTV